LKTHTDNNRTDGEFHAKVWVPLYADDKVMFVRPVAKDIDLVMGILRVLGAATVLKTNIQKSSVTPIRCSTEELDMVQ
jgi:hypothetical protein